MKASETKFQPIIEGTKQYVVPLFQRAYSWDKKEWGTLWEDIEDLCGNDEPRDHFIGSIVTMPTTSVPEGVTKYLLIDGQQRLTTIFILLTLLRDKALDKGDQELAEEIQQTMLVNPFKKGGDHFKLLPTQVDRVAFQALIQRKATGEHSQVYKCYEFFKKKTNKADIKALSKVLTSRFSVVSIVLDHDDNPHLVFESLNATGRQLTQADLLRNYFFMRIHTDMQTEIHDQYWQPMQSDLQNNLTEYIRHYMMRDGNLVKQGDVYFTLKNRVEKEQNDAIQTLREISTYAVYYKRLVDPSTESNSEVRSALKRLNRLDITTAYPFLLNCYHDFAMSHLSSKDFIKILQTLENYIVRRFVCNIPTSHYNKMFPFLYGWAKANNPGDFVAGVRAELQKRDYPRDSQFRSRLTDAKLYGTGERTIKTKLILETIESHYNHKEQVPFDNLTIEHVLPQTITDWWKQHLGDDWQADHEFYVHTLGNLTLTAYNPELSNDTFPKKQHRFAQSHVSLNEYFTVSQKWDRAEIEKRSAVLADLALICWPYFGEESRSPTTINADGVKGRTPHTLVILDQHMSVSTWVDVLSTTLNVIADLEPALFDILTTTYNRFISKEPTRFKRKVQLRNGYYVDTHLRSKHIYQFCEQAIETIGLTRDDWRVETL